MSSLEPTVFENLWYYDSVVSLKASQPPPPPSSPPPPESNPSTLPLSTGGESSPRACSLLPIFTEDEEDGDGHDGRSSSSTSRSSSATSCVHCKNASSQQQHPLCGIVEKIKHEDELSAEDMEEWMRKLGLEYTEDRMMVRRARKHRRRANDEGGGKGEEDPETVDFTEFVCVSKFIEEQTGPSTSSEEGSMNSLHRVFRLFDRDDKGLICPHELRAALAQLGLGGKIDSIA